MPKKRLFFEVKLHAHNFDHGKLHCGYDHGKNGNFVFKIRVKYFVAIPPANLQIFPTPVSAKLNFNVARWSSNFFIFEFHSLLMRESNRVTSLPLRHVVLVSRISPGSKFITHFYHKTYLRKPHVGACCCCCCCCCCCVCHACTKDKVSCSPEKISSETFAAGKKI